MSILRNAFHYFKPIYLPVFILFGALVYTAQQSGWPLPSWANHYLNDFLCMPIVLFVCRYAVRHLKSNGNLQLSLPVTFSVTLYYAIYFEFYLPKINLRYTADPLDVILYFSGALFFYFMENKLPKLGHPKN